MSERLMPREKALEFGIASLSNSELLALVIKSAYRDSDVFELADDVIEKANGFENLLSLTYEELTSIKGIKKAKAMEILAILEISKRLSKVDRICEETLDKPSKVVDWLRYSLAHSMQEEFLAVFLNSRSSVIRSEVLYRGNKHSANVSVDEILRKALLLNASFLLVAHNHPSGSVQPSAADVQLTDHLSKACKTIGIPLVDHIIVSKSDSFSFRNHSLL